MKRENIGVFRLGVVLICGVLSACSGIIATTEGIKALNDGTNGTIRSVRENPDSDSKYFGHRQGQETEKSKRSFVQMLLN